MDGVVTGNGVAYIYDGSFHGLMSLCFDLLRGDVTDCEILREEPREALLFSDYVGVDTDHRKAGALMRAIQERVSPDTYKRVLLCYLSEVPNAEELILNYLAFAREQGGAVDDFCTHDAVKPVIHVSEKVLREWHRMLGLLRFRKTGEGIFYAPMEPDHNILPLISPHFAERMSGERWIICDTKRGIASHYVNGSWEIVNFELTGDPHFGESEHLFQEMWASYFETIAIKERKNKKLQRSFVPQRYWKNLVEPIA